MRHKVALSNPYIKGPMNEYIFAQIVAICVHLEAGPTPHQVAAYLEMIRENRKIPYKKPFQIEKFRRAARAL